MPVAWRPKKQRDATYFSETGLFILKNLNYYSSKTCPFRMDKQNCFMHGRPDRMEGQFFPARDEFVLVGWISFFMPTFKGLEIRIKMKIKTIWPYVVCEV